MSFAGRHNTTTFDIPFDTKNFDFVKCSELKDNKIYRVYGYFASVGNYGKQYSLITDTCYINLPKHLTDVIDDFDEEDIKDIKDGKVGVKKRDYTSKNGKDCSTIVWVDIS